MVYVHRGLILWKAQLFLKPPFSSKILCFDSKEEGRYHIQDSATSHNHIKLSPWNTALHDSATASFILAAMDTQPQRMNSPLQGSCLARYRNNENRFGNRSPEGCRHYHPIWQHIHLCISNFYMTHTLYPPPKDERGPPFLERSPTLKLLQCYQNIE